MKIIIAFCFPLLVSAQSFVITQHTSLSISYEPIALIRVQAPIIALATEAPSEAGEGFLGRGQSIGQIELLMSVSRHGPKDVLGRLLNLPPLRILCSVSGRCTQEITKALEPFSLMRAINPWSIFPMDCAPD